MMNIKYKYAFLTAFILMFIMACKKDFNPEINLPRQFKPGDISITAGETQARLQWSPSLFTTGTGSTYTVEVSQDSLFQGPVVFTRVVDSAYAIVTDSVLAVNEFYFARVKANANGSTAESGWVHSGRFRITGEQIFLPIIDAQLKDTTVILRWRPSTGLTSIRLTPAGGTATTINLTSADIAANEKFISGLIPSTQYTATIFRNNVLKGTITFTTKEKNIYAFTLSPNDDLIEAVNNAANGDLIGLNPGTYSITNSSGAYTNLIIQQKNITITSISGDPTDTRVNFKEITLKGTGAGVTLRGIEFNGTAGNADYFINYTGLASDAEAANFANLLIDNSIVRGTNNSLIRGNRAANNAHKIDSITLRNSIFSDNGSSAGFDYILLDKMDIKSLWIVNSTFYNSGRRLISWATNFTSPKPVILINYVTINSIGYGARDFVLIDANANPVNFTMKNSIMANTPKPGQTVGNNLLRASSTSSSVVISHSNLFNLNNGSATAPATLIIPSYVSLQNNISVDLEWTGATTNFTLLASSPVRTASETNGPIGDPRWW